MSATKNRLVKDHAEKMQCARRSVRLTSVLTKRIFYQILNDNNLTENGRNLSTTSTLNGEKKLFTPGPLGTSPTVKAVMQRDLGSRDVEFLDLIKYIRSKLIEIAGVSPVDWTAVPMQGSGTFAIESFFQTAIPRTGAKVLILEGGAYGKRLGKICEVMGVDHHVESFPENQCVDPARVREILSSDKSFTTVAVVHSETSSGVINPVTEIGKVVKEILPNCDYFVDAMSSFGVVPLDLEDSKVDYLVSSVNKCLEGVPGFSYIIARLAKFNTCKGNSRSLTLDAYDQYVNMEKTNQFRFTPPTHTMLAFAQAIKEFEEEGGVPARAERYRQNRAILKEGMKKMGFREFLDSSHEGYIITSFHYPTVENFSFEQFYKGLNEKDQVIYPGKVLKADCFRIGSIGYLFPKDMEYLLQCIQEVCQDMGISLPIEE